MCSHCSYHTSAEWELDSALADADDDTRAAHWASQAALGSSPDDSLAVSGDPAALATADDARVVDD